LLEHERFGADRFDLLPNLSEFLFAAGQKDDSSELAASRSAVAFPIPELAPVTIATEFDMLFSACQGLLQVPVTERIASQMTATTAVGAVTLGV
jgi:hypothetical protein